MATTMDDVYYEMYLEDLEKKRNTLLEGYNKRLEKVAAAKNIDELRNRLKALQGYVSKDASLGDVTQTTLLASLDLVERVEDINRTQIKEGIRSKAFFWWQIVTAIVFFILGFVLR